MGATTRYGRLVRRSPDAMARFEDSRPDCLASVEKARSQPAGLRHNAGVYEASFERNSATVTQLYAIFRKRVFCTARRASGGNWISESAVSLRALGSCNKERRR